MAIQNIEDVIDRIMNLNKNLTEDSLSTLLSASGWDKEDIIEGIHVFKNLKSEGLEKNNVSPIFASTIPSVSKVENIKPSIQDPVSAQIPQEKEINNSINSTSLSPESKIEKMEDIKINNPIPSSIPNPISLSSINRSEEYVNSGSRQGFDDQQDKRKKILKFSLIGFLIVMIICVWLSILGSNVDNNLPNSNISNSKNTNNLSELIKNANELKIQLINYQKTKNPGDIIFSSDNLSNLVRDVYSMTASSSGFIISYTDNTSDFVPFSTSTVLNVLNSGSICFTDTNSSNTNVCLDKNTVKSILNQNK